MHRTTLKPESLSVDEWTGDWRVQRLFTLDSRLIGPVRRHRLLISHANSSLESTEAHYDQQEYPLLLGIARLWGGRASAPNTFCQRYLCSTYPCLYRFKPHSR